MKRLWRQEWTGRVLVLENGKPIYRIESIWADSIAGDDTMRLEAAGDHLRAFCEDLLGAENEVGVARQTADGFTVRNDDGTERPFRP